MTTEHELLERMADELSAIRKSQERSEAAIKAAAGPALALLARLAASPRVRKLLGS